MAEQLHGLKMGEGTIAVAVSSAGCTTPEHFTVEVMEAGELAITVVRTSPDHCKMMPQVIEIELSLPEQARTTAFKVQNQFIKGPVWPPSP